MDLPATWDGYLEQLNTKQRHEVRRKLRRLAEAGRIDYYYVKGDQNLGSLMDDFMRLFALAREEKAGFMTGEMETYFRSLASALAGIGVLRLGALDVDGRRVAMIMCFDYNNCTFLYNSGCDPQYESLSVGLLSKVLCIKESIQEGKKKFDFLKGGEVYKQRLGGKEIPLHRCHIVIG
jgi:CelD/BcsL family acetyltransferase involved in cellulose biosynthesis